MHNQSNYEKQRNFFIHQLRKSKSEYFEKLNAKDLSDNKRFWKTIKPYFSNKDMSSNKLVLEENNRINTKKKEIAAAMNTFFVNVTEGLDRYKEGK